MAYRKSEVSRYHSEINLFKCFKIMNMVLWRKLNVHSIYLFLKCSLYISFPFLFLFVPQSKLICPSGRK